MLLPGENVHAEELFELGSFRFAQEALEFDDSLGHDLRVEITDAAENYLIACFLLDELSILVGSLSARKNSVRDHRIVSMRYGLFDGVGRTYKQIGEEFGIKYQRVREVVTEEQSRFRTVISSRF